MNTLPVPIRPALPGDIPLVASLIQLTMGEEMDWLFGGTALSATEVVTDLVGRRGNRFSREFCWMAEEQGQAVGLLLAFPGSLLPRLELTMGWQLLRIIGLAATWRIARKQREYGELVEASRDEFYVSHVGVVPEFQGRSIGSALLHFAESLALASNLQKCSLLVSRNNPACRLYTRHGYHVAAEYPTANPAIAHGAGYYRMIKSLSLPDPASSGELHAG